MGQGRFVLFGDDDSGELRWHHTTIDMLAGAPAWLPYDTLRERIEGHEVGCVYWYERGVWARAPYPDELVDEAHGDTAKRLLADAEAGRLEPRQLLERLRTYDDYPGSRDLPAICRALVAAGIAA
ncbi:hypothetical protein ACFC06_26645 [Nocardia sp. NPDC056064]|uniref:hypothetical protein n=1 Tax=Nocardia sp. NPDC056064 TaxID=3345701 RepID=UPI0035DE9FE7